MRKFVIGILVVGIAGFVTLKFVVPWVKDLFNVQGSISQTLVFIEVPRPKLELATLEVDALVKDDIADDWPPPLPLPKYGNALTSTSRLSLQAVYKVKLGYDLQNSPEKISVICNSENGKIVSVDTKQLAVRVLSCEMQPGTLSIDSRNGWWNKIEEEDKAAAISFLGEKARQQVGKQQEILTRAATSLEAELKKILQVELDSGKGKKS